MAFSLISYYAGEKHFIHKQFGQSDSSPNVTKNMNFALLFAVESDARRFKKKNNLIEFEPEFIPIAIKVEPKSTRKIYYTRLRDLKGKETVEDSLPDFFNEV